MKLKDKFVLKVNFSLDQTFVFLIFFKIFRLYFSWTSFNDFVLLLCLFQNKKRVPKEQREMTQREQRNMLGAKIMKWEVKKRMRWEGQITICDV